MATTNGYITKAALPTYEFVVGSGTPVDYLLHGNTSNPTLDSSSNGYVATNGGGVVSRGLSKFNDGGAALFNGSTDYMSASSYMIPATGDFTVEFWLYSNDVTNVKYIWGQDYATTGGIYVYQSSGTIRMYVRDQIAATSFGNISTGTWYHVALVRSGNTLTAYLNGTSGGSGTVSTIATGNSTVIGGRDSGAGFYGSIEEFRVSTTARYTSNFTAPTAPFDVDASTRVLLHMNGADASTTFTDSAGILTWTRYGSLAVDVDITKFGGSLYFPGGSTGYLQLNGQTDFALGTGDFTIAFWVYHDNATQPQHIVEGRGTGITPVIYVNASMYRFYDGGSDRIFGGTFTTNTWTHIALCRKSGVTKMYQNGTQIGSSYTDSNNYVMSASRPYIGCYQPGTVPLRGYLEEFLWIKGYALYDGNFTVPSSPYESTIGSGTTYSTSTYGVIKLG